MRISETNVVQLVDSDPPQVVFVDDVTGAEVALDPAALIRAEAAIDYFRLTGGFPSCRATCTQEGHPPGRVDDLETGQTVCPCGVLLRKRGASV